MSPPETSNASHHQTSKPSRRAAQGVQPHEHQSERAQLHRQRARAAADPAGTSEDNSRFGTLGSLDTFYDCPPVIKHVLCDSAGHSSVFLIPDDRCVDAVFGNTNIRLMFSPTKRHAKTVSRCGAAPLCLLLAALPRRCACTAHPCRTALFEAQPAQCVSLRKEAPRCRYNKAGVSFMSQMMRPAQFMTVQVDEAAVQHLSLIHI